MKLERDLTPEEYILLARLCEFCDRWEGKVVRTYTDVPSRTHPPAVAEKPEFGWCIGHDGPVWRSDAGRAVELEPDLSHGAWIGSHHALMGWGCVVFVESPGTTRYVDPSLLVRVEEDHEFCPFGCKDGWLQDRLDDGAEYEVVCECHRPDDYYRARELWLLGWDDRTEEQHHELARLTTPPQVLA